MVTSQWTTFRTHWELRWDLSIWIHGNWSSIEDQAPRTWSWWESRLTYMNPSVCSLKILSFQQIFSSTGTADAIFMVNVTCGRIHLWDKICWGSAEILSRINLLVIRYTHSFHEKVEITKCWWATVQSTKVSSLCYVHYFEIVYSHFFVLYLFFFSGLMLIIWRTNLGGPNSLCGQLHPLGDDWRHRGRTSFLQVFSCWWAMSFGEEWSTAWDNNYWCLLVSNESHIRHSECFNRYEPMPFVGMPMMYPTQSIHVPMPWSMWFFYYIGIYRSWPSKWTQVTWCTVLHQQAFVIISV